MKQLGAFEEAELLLGWRKESVEIERKGIELLVTVIASECSELYPPWHASVLLGLLNFQCVIEKNTDDQPDSRRRQKYSIQESIELQTGTNAISMNKQSCRSQ